MLSHLGRYTPPFYPLQLLVFSHPPPVGVSISVKIAQGQEVRKGEKESRNGLGWSKQVTEACTCSHQADLPSVGMQDPNAASACSGICSFFLTKREEKILLS